MVQIYKQCDLFSVQTSPLQVFWETFVLTSGNGDFHITVVEDSLGYLGEGQPTGAAWEHTEAKPGMQGWIL